MTTQTTTETPADDASQPAAGATPGDLTPHGTARPEGDAADGGEALARIEVLTPISLIVPTFRERENIPIVVERVEALRQRENLEIELLFMDDDSKDGSAEWVQQCGRDWVRLVTRTEDRGLSPAVIDGLKAARHGVLICMDADLSHPPEAIPRMVYALEAGAQFVIGSRYVPGGSTDDDWGFFRWLNSQVATILARPFCDAKDPMAGFFALRRVDFLNADKLNPVGYKIGLELIVKCGLKNIGEVPIHFADRVHGESKLTFKEQLRYLLHLRRLFLYKFATWTHLAHFLAVGASGVVVNLVVFTILLALSVNQPWWEDAAYAIAVGTSILTNFALNRRFTFGYARHRKVLPQMLGFIGVSLFAGVINWTVRKGVATLDPSIIPQVTALFGIAAGMGFNFVFNRFIVFRVEQDKPTAEDGAAAIGHADETPRTPST